VSAAALESARRTARRGGGAERRARGSTLLELLIVLGILALLTAVLLPRFTRASIEAERQATRTRLESVALMIDKYEIDRGEYPPSRLSELGIEAPNGVNEGVEALVAALESPAFGGPRPESDVLSDVDDDAAKDLPTILGTDRLFELADSWGNPCAYFHRRSYGEIQVYRLEDADGAVEEQQVEAVKDAKTGTYRRPEGYQLFSAGPDGRFATEDDVAPWD
jgi:type II secretory pathway pseudopilin PulG